MFAPRLALPLWLSLLVAAGHFQTASAQTTPDRSAPEETETTASVTSLPSLSPEVHQAMQSRQFEQAIVAIDASLKAKESDAKDYLQYLKGIALTELGKFDEAIAAFELLEKDDPKSQWVSRARFGRANVFVVQRQYTKAGEIYRAEAERLLSRERKDELAAIYLEFADRYYDGVPSDDPSKAKKPDYAQALTYYEEAVKLKPTNKLLQKIHFRIARCYEGVNKNAEAIAGYQRFLKDYAAKEPASGLSAPAAIEAEVRFRLGAVQLNAGQSATARRTWRDFLDSADDVAQDNADQEDGDDGQEKVDEFLAKAEYRLAHTYGLPKPSSVGDLELGVAAAERFLDHYPHHELAAAAELEIAQGYTHHRRFRQAVDRLGSLIGNPKYEESKQLPIARRMLGQAYLSQQRFDDAIAAWNEFLNSHPTDPQWPRVQEWIVNAEYSKAQSARTKKEYDVARNVWQTFLNKYPLDSRAPRILALFGQMKHSEAVEKHVGRIKDALDRGDSPQSVSVNDECEKLFLEAIADWRRLVTKYPGTAEASEASYMIGTTLEDRLSQLPEALDAYKNVKGNYEQKAKQRIAKLTSPQLSIVTERKFRSDETPRIKLTTRNLEKVSVKAYRVDMTDYFRKMHLASGIETLDIALIDPDTQFEHQVKGFQEYQRIDSDIEIPVDGVGVTAVTVSSEKQEVTTMVIVSDLDVIVKSSRNELLLFAENMRTGKPLAGTSVLISDGSDVFAEELTNKDGVLQKSFPQLKEVGDLRVFAVHEGHVASTINRLNGLDFAVGLTPRCYLYTDRPAYRAGQLVNIKGIVRWVDQDRFTFKPGEKFKLDVYDARGRQIRSSEVALNEFGTVHQNLVLPETASQGDYRVHLHRPSAGTGDSTGALSFETRFQVAEYRLEPIQVDIELDKEVYFRGEKVKGSVRLKYYYGTPLADEKITYTFGGGETVTATTDDNGTVEVEFDTQRFSESQTLTLNVQYPDRGIQQGQTVYLATRGFGIGVQSRRDVYISGETFDTSFKVTDPAGNAIGTSLKVEVIRQVRVGGQPGEKVLQTHEIETDEESGEASQTISIEEGGVYIVRATGTDQFDNEISGQKLVRISGSKDSVRLRILAEKHNYQVGEQAEIRVHWREQPALALVTFEGASILRYQLVNLKKGDNTLKVPMTTDLAPNFFLNVAVMENNRFHSASSGFQVKQQLFVKLTPSTDTLRPGEELQVAIEVTDSQGRPVKSEISLALIQTNLLHSFNDIQGTIDAFFGSGNREPSVRQKTSCTFKYRPQTRQVSQFLLAEAERRSSLERELRALSRETQVRGRPDAGTVLLGGIRLGRSVSGPGPGVNGPGPGDIDFDGDGIAGIFGELDGEQLDSLAGALSQGQLPGIVVDDFQAPVQTVPIVGDFAVAQTVIPAFSQRHVQSFSISGQQQAAQQEDAFYSQNSLPMPGQMGGGQMGSRPRSTNRAMATGGVPVQQRGQIRGYYNSLDGQVDRFESNLSLVQSQDTAWFGKLSERDETINALTNRGMFLAVNGRSSEELARLARDEGLQLLPSMANAETAFWDPMIVTDQAGKAEVIITMPNRSTAWRLRAKGIDGTSLSGEATANVITKKDLFGDLKLPLAFTTGDKADVPIEIHQSLEGKHEIQVELKVTTGDRSTTQKRTIEVNGPGVTKIEFPVEVSDADLAEFELSVRSDDRKDVANRAVRILPYGFPVYETVSGTASQSTIAIIDFDDRTDARDPSLEILIGASVNRSLIESVIGGVAVPLQRCGIIPSNGLERNSSDILGGVALLKMIGDAQNPDTPEAQALTSRITGALAAVISAQRDDGAWSWSGHPKRGTADAYLSARLMWALSTARESGYAVPADAFEKGKSFLKSAFANASGVELEKQTILLHAMAECRCADFALANRLYRERNRLSVSGLTYLALALCEMNRKTMAGDLIEMVNLESDASTAAKRSSQRANNVIPWMQSGVELRALYLLALQQTNPGVAEAEQMAQWLVGSRVGSRWPIEKANGPVISALANWHARTRHVSEKYTMTVSVNDEEVGTFTVDPSKEGSRRVEVPKEIVLEHLRRKGQADGVLAKGLRIHLDLEGRGTFSYSAILTGFVDADDLQKTTDSWTVARRYEPAQRMFEGRSVPRGFGVVDGPYKSFFNPLTELPVGQRSEVTLSPRRRGTTGRAGEQYDYLVLTEPIPAGCTVLDGSVRGSYERFEVGPGQITFYIGAQRYPNDIQYTLVGYVPGSYRTAPSLLRSFYDPSQMAIADVKSLKVLDSSEKSSDEYRLTPDELYHLGQKELGNKNYEAAHKHLTELLGQWRLDEDKNKNAVQWLLRAALERDSHGEIVKYFEVIKERYPSIELSFSDILQVALSYRELGEYERSYLVYRSTVEASFERESQVAGFLNARGEFIRSVAAMERLLSDYPAESYVATATYALAQEVYRRAPNASADENLKKQGINRVHLINGSIKMLDHFVSTWPNDPADDQASFALATALIDLDQYEAAIERCEQYAKRYPKSRLLDSYWYMIGYSHFELENHEQALEMCSKVASAQFPVPETGGSRDADNKWEAVYIMGQVYHSLGNAADAILQYTQVKQKFTDAAEAIEYFTRKEITLDEVTTIKSSDPKRLNLHFRNLPEVALKVYRIDLMKFGLMQRNLDRITAINLAGIKPYHEEVVRLGDGLDYRDRDKDLELPLKEEGAYLVVCRGENLYASGLVLVSPLTLTVSEDAQSGRVRVNVKDSTKDTFVGDVHVKVIGSANDQFKSGTTDLRGLFVADDVKGTSTVIAQLDQDQYAFFRGESSLQGVAPNAPADDPFGDTDAEASEAAPQAPSKVGKDALRGNIFDMNGSFQEQQKGNFDGLLNNDRDGISTKEAY